MDLHFAPERQPQIDRIVIETGLTQDDLIGNAMAGYLAELSQTREMLDSRYDDLKNGRVQPIDGESFFGSLLEREAALLPQRP